MWNKSLTSSRFTRTKTHIIRGFWVSIAIVFLNSSSFTEANLENERLSQESNKLAEPFSIQGLGSWFSLHFEGSYCQVGHYPFKRPYSFPIQSITLTTKRISAFRDSNARKSIYGTPSVFACKRGEIDLAGSLKGLL